MVERWKSFGSSWGREEPRRRKPRERIRAEGRRKNRREKVRRGLFVVGGMEVGSSGLDSRTRWWSWDGANKSDREPVRRRAMVDVRAIVETCVEGRPAGGGASDG